MTARDIAARLTPPHFPGPYAREADIYPDLKRALVQITGPEAAVHVERQDYDVIRSVHAFAQDFRPDGAVVVDGRRIGVEAKLLRHAQESGSLASAVLQGLVLALGYDEALIVLVSTGEIPAFLARERAMLDGLWEPYRVAWAEVRTPVPAAAPAAVPAAPD
jgi:hypothetical protein